MKVIFSQYEVSILQEMSSIIIPKLPFTDLAETKSEYEVNEIIRNEWLEDFRYYLVREGYLDSLTTSISGADFSKHNTSDLEVIDTFCDIKLKGIGYKTPAPACSKRFDDDVAYILVQLTEDFSKDLYEKYDKTMNDTNLRGEFLFKMAQEIASSPEWKDPDLTAGEVIYEAIEKKKTELVMSKAKFKVGDEVLILYYSVEKVKVQSVHWNEQREEFWYKVGNNDYSDYEIYENYLYKDVHDLITALQLQFGEGK